MNYEDLIKNQDPRRYGYVPIPGRRMKFPEVRPLILSTIEHVAAIRDDYARKVAIRLLGSVMSRNLAAAYRP